MSGRHYGARWWRSLGYPANIRNRRTSPVAEPPGEGLLSEAIAVARPGLGNWSSCPIADPRGQPLVRPEIALCPNHGVARDEAGEGFLRPILRSWGTLRYDNIAPLGRGVPDAYLDIRIELDAKLP